MENSLLPIAGNSHQKCPVDGRLPGSSESQEQSNSTRLVRTRLLPPPARLIFLVSSAFPPANACFPRQFGGFSRENRTRRMADADHQGARRPHFLQMACPWFGSLIIANVSCRACARGSRLGSRRRPGARAFPIMPRSASATKLK